MSVLRQLTSAWALNTSPASVAYGARQVAQDLVTGRFGKSPGRSSRGRRISRACGSSSGTSRCTPPLRKRAAEWEKMFVRRYQSVDTSTGRGQVAWLDTRHSPASMWRTTASRPRISA